MSDFVRQVYGIGPQIGKYDLIYWAFIDKKGEKLAALSEIY